MPLDRRTLLKGAAFVAAGAAMPAVFVRAVYAAEDRGGARSATGGQKTLVVVQQAGGCDALNVVVPWQDSQYYPVRGNQAISEEQLHKLPDPAQPQFQTGFGLHPSLPGLAGIWGQGRLGIVLGVGYPNPDLSHFRSMQVWHTGDPVNSSYSGWLGT
jgi:uncharacterized protein (DUF1501 family)